MASTRNGWTVESTTRTGLEGQGRVGDLRHAYAGSTRGRKNDRSEGGEIPAPACSAGEVRPTRRHADAAHRSLTRSFRRFSRILTTTEAHFWARKRERIPGNLPIRSDGTPVPGYCTSPPKDR